MEIEKSRQEFRGRVYCFYNTYKEEISIATIKRIIQEIHKDYPQVPNNEINILCPSTTISLRFCLPKDSDKPNMHRDGMYQKNIEKIYREETNSFLLTYFISINACTVDIFNTLLDEIHKDYPNIQDEDMNIDFNMNIKGINTFALLAKTMLYLQFSVPKEDFILDAIPKLMDLKEFYSYFNEPL